MNKPAECRMPPDAPLSPLPALFPLGQTRGASSCSGLELANLMALLFSAPTHPNLEGTLLLLEPGILSLPRRREAPLGWGGRP